MGCCWSTKPKFPSASSTIKSSVELTAITDTPSIIISPSSLTSGIDATVKFEKHVNVISNNQVGKEGEIVSCCVVVPVLLEQDSCYWEVHVSSTSPPPSLTIGVSTKIPPAPLQKLISNLLQTPSFLPPPSLQFYCTTIPCDKGKSKSKSNSDVDVYGIAYNQIDFPMLSVTKNDALIHEIDKTSGGVYPVICVNGVGEAGVCFQERGFKCKGSKAKVKRFGTVIKARGLI